MNKIIKENTVSRGRPKGSPNRVTTEFRDTVKNLLHDNSENVARWLATVAEGDGDQVKPDPKGALDMLTKLAEFATPKLARTVVAGDSEQPIEHIYKWKD
jgi:hypothetical protein